MSLPVRVVRLAVLCVCFALAACAGRSPSPAATSGAALSASSPTLPSPTAARATTAASPTVAATATLAPSPTVAAAPTATAMATAATRGDPQRGKALFSTSICVACHSTSDVSGGDACPNLSQIGTVAATRRPGYSAAEYIRESIQDPSAFIVPGWPDAMPKGLAKNFTDEQFDDLVAYLLTQQ